MKLVVAVAGLPGSGKSFYAADLAATLGFPRINDPAIVHGSEGAAAAILRALADADGVVADAPRWCACEDRLALEVGLDAPDLMLRWVYFAPDFESCLANLLRDGGGERLKQRVRCLARHEPRYEVPEGCHARPVWRPGR